MRPSLHWVLTTHRPPSVEVTVDGDSSAAVCQESCKQGSASFRGGGDICCALYIMQLRCLPMSYRSSRRRKVLNSFISSFTVP